MTLIDVAPYVAMLISVFVWALTQWANRKHEIFKERLKKRVDMFDGLLPEISKFVTAANLNDDGEANAKTARLQGAIDRFGDYRIKMLCYGTDEERHAYEEFIDTIEKRNMTLLIKKNKILVDLVRKNLRAELGIE